MWVIRGGVINRFQSMCVWQLSLCSEGRRGPDAVSEASGLTEQQVGVHQNTGLERPLEGDRG